uniref:TIGR03936 family radical SAM-associated protein n=1 Tax=Agathobacter sp. TaxID=2021311 RepID=UPI00405677BE
MKIRVKFRKWGHMKFIGHLDMLRYFQKAVRRAGIDICYSGGFSPHQIMSFAAPLGVGITSDGEYFDIEVNTTKSTEESLKDFNAAMADGVEVTGYVQLPDNAKTAMSIVTAADYVLSYKDGYESPYSLEEWKEKTDAIFHAQSSFSIVKKTKKSEREMDLKPLVHVLDVIEQDNRPAFYMRVSTGSTDNIKPELLLSSIYEKLGLAYEEAAIAIHRKDVYAADEATGKLISLLELGTVLD